MNASQLRPVFTQYNSSVCVCASLKHWWCCRRHSSLREEVQESAHLNRDSASEEQTLTAGIITNQLSQNERRQTRPDKRSRGDSATELPRRPEGETRQKSHEDLGEGGDGHRLLYVCFSRSFLLSHLLCALLDTRWFHEHHEDNRPLVQSGIETCGAGFTRAVTAISKALCKLSQHSTFISADHCLSLFIRYPSSIWLCLFKMDDW